MRKPIVADQADFERWLVEETAVFADMARRIDEGTSRQEGVGAEITKSHFICLVMVLGRYTDRDPAHLHPVAHDRAALMDVIRNGESLLARCERQTEEMYRKLEGGEGS